MYVKRQSHEGARESRESRMGKALTCSERARVWTMQDDPSTLQREPAQQLPNDIMICDLGVGTLSPHLV